MQKLLCILSFTLGLASPVFANLKAGTILELGRIIDKRLTSHKNADGADVPHWRIVVAFRNSVYDCWVYQDAKKGINCEKFNDFGVTPRP